MYESVSLFNLEEKLIKNRSLKLQYKERCISNNFLTYPFVPQEIGSQVTQGFFKTIACSKDRFFVPPEVEKWTICWAFLVLNDAPILRLKLPRVWPLGYFKTWFTREMTPWAPILGGNRANLGKDCFDWDGTKGESTLHTSLKHPCVYSSSRA